MTRTLSQHDAAILRGAALPTGVVGVVVVVVCGLAAGTKGAIGAAFGAAVVAAFFTAGLVAIAWASKINAYLMMNVAIVTYLVKIALLGLLVVLFAGTTAFSTRSFAAAVLVSTLVWVLAEIRAFSRLKMLYVEPGSGGEPR